MRKPKTFNGDLAHLPSALAPMVALDHWLLWRWEYRNGIWTKPPFSAANPGARAKNNDPATWSNYKTAIAVIQNGGGFDGIGFALLETPFDVVDLDHCLDPATGHRCVG
jgi:primase-polymerase (primpol)-like protein